MPFRITPRLMLEKTRTKSAPQVPIFFVRTMKGWGEQMPIATRLGQACTLLCPSYPSHKYAATKYSISRARRLLTHVAFALLKQLLIDYLVVKSNAKALKYGDELEQAPRIV